MQRPLVQVLNGKLSSTQSRQQVHLRLAKQIIPLSPKPRVILFLEHNDHIPRYDPRLLITFTIESNLLTALHPLVDVHFQDFALGNRLFPNARLASILGVHDFSSSLALVTWLLDLLHHRSELS